jgi:hypothetical protein
MSHLIAMERVYACVPTAFSRPEIKSAIIVADKLLEEMWASGKAYGHLKTPTKRDVQLFLSYCPEVV